MTNDVKLYNTICKLDLANRRRCSSKRLNNLQLSKLADYLRYRFLRDKVNTTASWEFNKLKNNKDPFGNSKLFYLILKKHNYYD